MDKYCGSAFWDTNVTWNTNDPDLTECFEKTVLLWAACGFLWATAIFDLYFRAGSLRGITALDHPTWLPGWTKLTVLKIFNIAFLICIEIAGLVIEWLEGTSEDIISIPDVLWTTPIVLIVTHFLSAVLVYFHKTRCVHTSGIQLIHWTLLSLLYVTILRTEINQYLGNKGSFVSTTLVGVSCGIMIIQAVAFCWSDIPASKPGDHSHLVDSMDGQQRQECPLVRASCLSFMMFSWSTKLVRTGSSRPLLKEDLWDLIPSIKAKPVSTLFEHHYGKPKYGESRGIWRNILLPIWKTCGWPLTLAMICRFLSSILEFLSPKLMGFMIDFVSEKDQEAWKGYMWAILLFVNYIAIVVILEQFYFHMFKVYVGIMICLNLRIYRKSLCVTSESRKETTTGEIVNLMSVDVEKVRELAYVLDSLWATPIQILLGIVLLYLELGVAIFSGLAVLCAVIPINWALTTFSSRYQRARMSKKDERIKILNEVLSGIQIVKLYAWEPSFQGEAQKVRSEEINILKKRAIVRCFIELLFNSIPFLVSTAAFVTYAYVNGSAQLDAKKAFTALSLFNLLTEPITTLPTCIAQVVDATVSFKRINKFLNSEELHPEATHCEKECVDGLPAVEIENGNFSWESDTSCLTNINLSLDKGTLTAVVGSVASGKSSLLSAILGEMKHSGKTTTRGSVAYVAQVAWILNATLRENICFGLPYDKQKYDRIIEACCLVPDIEMLPAGDMTEIGEKGINLSGGQKQRVSLARAAYSGADILLLDDVLSAVDSHVGRHIFDQLLGPSGLLSNTTRILCTHAHNFLSQVDKVLVMSDGEIVETGSYEELMNGRGKFSRLLSQQVQSVRGGDDDVVDLQSSKFPGRKDVDKSEAAGKLITDENLETGDVKLSVFMAYLRALRYLLVVIVVILFALSQGMEIGRNIVLSKWTASSEEGGGLQESYLVDYAILGVSQNVVSLAAYVLLAYATLRATRILHNDMLQRILRAPMSFFNVTLLGRILNRFSSDVESVDSDLPSYIADWLNNICRFLGVLVTISYTNVYFIVYIVPLFVIYYILQRYYIKCMQQLQRLMSSLKSPIYAQFSETLNGTSTIRSYRAQDRFALMLADKIDNHNRALFPHLIVRRWLSIRLGLIGSTVVFIPALFAVIWRNSTSGSLVGLSITYALQFTFILSWFVKCTSYIQYNFVSVERILEYSAVEQEAELENPMKTISPQWPENGSIEFINYETRYRPGLDLVLKHFSCKILPGEKIGIVGRTGAGKSSLTLALFRIIEASAGEILVDQVNIASLGLHDVRRRLTVIPQDPVLFSRPLRLNLDPFGEYNDEQLWQALELAHLKSYVVSLSEGLGYPIAEGGENLSVGQRQLVCLARAILRKSSILVLDEATASVDRETDELIQATIRSTFTGCTILNVAHRLNTVMDSSRVMVLSRGEIIEFDTPQALLANSNSYFYGMAKDAGLV